MPDPSHTRSAMGPAWDRITSRNAPEPDHREGDSANTPPKTLGRESAAFSAATPANDAPPGREREKERREERVCK